MVLVIREAILFLLSDEESYITRGMRQISDI
jgi:hypothetical protein